MKKSAYAKIKWLTDRSSGNFKKEGEEKLISVARFHNDPNWEQGSWSLVLELSRKKFSNKELIVPIHFLVDDAPHSFLTPGNHFEVLEGDRPILEGEIVTDSQ